MQKQQKEYLDLGILFAVFVSITYYVRLIV